MTELCARYNLCSIEYSKVDKERNIYSIDATTPNTALTMVSVYFHNTQISVREGGSQDCVADQIFFETGIWCFGFMLPFDMRWHVSHVVETLDMRQATIKVTILNSTCKDLTFDEIDLLSPSCLKVIAWKIFDSVGLPVIWQKHMWFRSRCSVVVLLTLPYPLPSDTHIIDATKVTLCRNTIGALEQLSRNNPHRAIHYVSNMEGPLVHIIRFIASRTDATCYALVSNKFDFTPRTKKLIIEALDDVRLAGFRDSVKVVRQVLDQSKTTGGWDDSPNDYFNYLLISTSEWQSDYSYLFPFFAKLNCARAKFALASCALHNYNGAKRNDMFDLLWHTLQSETNPAITLHSDFQDAVATCMYFGIGCKAQPALARTMLERTNNVYGDDSNGAIIPFILTSKGQPCSLKYNRLLVGTNGSDSGRDAVYLVTVKPSQQFQYLVAMNDRAHHISLDKLGTIVESWFGTSEEPRFEIAARKAKLVHCANRFEALRRCADWSREDRALLSFASDTQTCTICMESVATDVFLVQCRECGCMTHRKCFTEWAKRSSACTQCRHTIYKL